MKRFGIIGLVFVVASSVGCASASTYGSNWVELGERAVSDRLDHDEIFVTARRGEFRRIKLTVDRASVDFHRVVVHFGAGSRQRIDLRRTIPAGGETRSIDLHGDDRIIRKVEFWYDANSGGRRAVVRLYGRR